MFVDSHCHLNYLEDPAAALERARARGVPVHEARGVAHGKMIPFLPVLELFRSFFRVAEQDAAETARDKIAGRLVRVDPALTDSLPVVFDFLDVPDPERPAPQTDPEGRQRQLFAIAKRLLQALGGADPAVVLVEDLHWIDGASEGFLEQMVEAVGEKRFEKREIDDTPVEEDDDPDLVTRRWGFLMPEPEDNDFDFRGAPEDYPEPWLETTRPSTLGFDNTQRNAAWGYVEPGRSYGVMSLSRAPINVFITRTPTPFACAFSRMRGRPTWFATMSKLFVKRS